MVARIRMALPEKRRTWVGDFTSQRRLPGRQMNGGIMQKKWIMDEFRHAQKEGIYVDVQGVSYSDKSPEEFWQVLQEGNYMLDYEGDSLGHIVALHIDPVEPSKPPSYKKRRR